MSGRPPGGHGSGLWPVARVTNAGGDLSPCSYDVTSLCYEAEKEDSLGKIGYRSAGWTRRSSWDCCWIGPLPLQIGCWKGNKAETSTIIPMIEDFRKGSGIEHLVMVPDAGMLPASSLQALYQAGMGFIVGSRMTKPPADLAAHLRRHGDALADGQAIDALTPRTGSCARPRETRSCVMSLHVPRRHIRARRGPSGRIPSRGSPGTT